MTKEMDLDVVDFAIKFTIENCRKREIENATIKKVIETTLLEMKLNPYSFKETYDKWHKIVMKMYMSECAEVAFLKEIELKPIENVDFVRDYFVLQLSINETWNEFYNFMASKKIVDRFISKLDSYNGTD